MPAAHLLGSTAPVLQKDPSGHSWQACADISLLSQYANEAEVLFPPNSQFVVEKKVTSEQEKHAILDKLPRMYDMSELDVYVLKQI